MDLSKGINAPVGLPSSRAVATCLRILSTSMLRSARSERATAKPRAAPQRPRVKWRRDWMLLGSIAAIDLDVVFGQVAREDASFAFSICAMHDFDANLSFVKLDLQLVFVKRCGKAFFADELPLQVDVNVPRVELYTSVSCGANNTPPIGITTC